ncbi:MAG: 4Fe-4S binding protein [Pseudomonadota bacterium]
MTLDAAALEKAGCAVSPAAHQLCRAKLDRFQAALATGGPVTVTCTQEAPLFREVAEAEATGVDLSFANIRETAGWTAEAAQSGPKMAALVAAASVRPSDFSYVTMESAGVALILGRDEVALEVANALSAMLDITVLLKPGADVTPPRQTVYPVLQGSIRNAKGYLGAFTLTVDSYAAPDPSSRRRLVFGSARNGAVSNADLIIDLTGDKPLFPADTLRPGYHRADPRDPLAVARLVTAASHMVGTFDKPIFIDFASDLCAHSRNEITGCTRCLSLCPTGAIQPAGDSVAIDPNICAGCGQCAAACPTGAASYALPDVATVAKQLRAAFRAWHDAGGKLAPIALFHDADHGEPLIDAAARFGNGLPAHVIPFAVNEVSQIGPEIPAAALAYGAGAVALLGQSRPLHDLTGLHDGLALVDEVSAVTGHGPCKLIETDDPDELEAALEALPRAPRRAASSSFLPPEDKRGLLVTAFAEMNRVAPTPSTTIPLEKGAPFGTVIVDTGACTLCMACTGACPANALLDNPETPMLRFTESACVQCGLCERTCPENAISLQPQIDFEAWATPKRILNEEAPFECTSCGVPFATQSAITRIQEKLGTHWMFSGEEGEQRMKVLEMCQDCRVEAVVNEGFDPHSADTRRVRTIEDHVAEKDAQKHH